MRVSLTRFIQLSTLCLLLCLSACNSVNSLISHSHTTSTPATVALKSADDYLQLASTSIAPERQGYQLQAIARLIEQNNLSRAQQILSTVDTDEVSIDLKAQKQILAAKILIADNKPLASAGILTQIRLDDSLSNTTRRDIHQSLAIAHEKNGNIIASIDQRNQLNPYLSNNEERQENQFAIWRATQKIPHQELHTLLTQPLATNIRAWLELAQIKQAELSPRQHQIQLQHWQREHPRHPGNFVLQQHHAQYTQTAQTNKIYLLLPLHGKFAEQGKAIHNGFMAAYYAAKQSMPTPPSVTVLDTSENDIITHYNEAIRNNADFIVGPLTKANIERLVKFGRLSKPTLVLNNAMQLSKRNLYQFGLSQHQEAVQTAQHAFNDGHRHAIVIAPQTAWGQSVSQNFIQQWQELGGTLTDTLAYNNIKDLSPQLRNLLQVNQSETRAKEMKKLLGEDMRFVARRREDVECIFLVASATQARAIMPLLKFYYAGNVPVYTTSLVYHGIPNKRRDNDLENLQFADMPWVLGQLPSNLQQIKANSDKLWHKSFTQNPKFYALGADAFQLSSYLQHAEQFPYNGISGATGTLYLGQGQRIVRGLAWAKFRGGEPQLLQ